MSDTIEKKEPGRAQTLFDRIVNAVWYVLLIFVIVVVLHFSRRIFIAESFKVPSDSMRPTLVPGDKIWVNKLLYGARIYTSFNFDDHAPLKCFRMPGLREIRPNKHQAAFR